MVVVPYTWNGAKNQDWYSDNWYDPGNSSDPNGTPPPNDGSPVVLVGTGSPFVTATDPSLNIAELDINAAAVTFAGNAAISRLVLAGAGTGATINGNGTISVTTFDMGDIFNNNSPSAGTIGGILMVSLQSTGDIAVATNGNTIASGATLQIAHSATLTMDNTASITGGTVVNDGTLDASAGTIASIFTNTSTGIVQLFGGQFDLSGSSYQLAGTVQASASSVLPCKPAAPSNRACRWPMTA